jgi:hypothetical protein
LPGSFGAPPQNPWKHQVIFSVACKAADYSGFELSFYHSFERFHRGYKKV